MIYAINNAAMNEVSTYGPAKLELQYGYVNAYQDASVYIPVEVTPRADSGEINTCCWGEPKAIFHEDRGSGKCCLTIIQPIRVEIPLEFGAEALIGSPHVKCGEETDSECRSVSEEAIGGSRSEYEEKPLEPSLPIKTYKTFY